MKSLLVTGTDTDVGKTWVSCMILRQLVSEGIRVGAYKPACSGAVIAENGDSQWSDVELLRNSIGCDNIDLVCPQRFNAAVAPNVAAELEDRQVDDQLLTSGFRAWETHADNLLIEGAGGLCCPISNSTTVADLAEQLSTPIVIVAANRLGVINHTLLTVAVAQQRSIPIAAIVVNDTTQSCDDDESRDSNLNQLRKWLPEIPIFCCGYSADSFDQAVSVVGWFQ